MAKVKDEVKEAASAPEEINQLAMQQLQMWQHTNAPCSAPLDPATTCTTTPGPPLTTIHGTPILPFHLESSELGSASRVD